MFKEQKSLPSLSFAQFVRLKLHSEKQYDLNSSAGTNAHRLYSYEQNVICKNVMLPQTKFDGWISVRSCDAMLATVRLKCNCCCIHDIGWMDGCLYIHILTLYSLTLPHLRATCG